MVNTLNKTKIISTRDAFCDLEQILNVWNTFLKQQKHADIKLYFAHEKSKPVGIGNIKYTEEGIGVIVLNVPINLHEKKYQNSKNDYITKEDYRNIIIGLFHEIRHGKQELDETKQYNPRTRLLAMESLMTKRNSVAYEQEYNTASIDIDAEMFALQQSYVWLCEKFGEKEGEKLLLDYIDMRIKEDNRSPRYFGIKNAHDIDDIIQQFEEKFQQSLIYKPSFKYQTDFKGKSADEIDVYFRFFTDNPENQKLYHAENIHSGLDNLKMMFAVTARYFDIGRMLPKGHILKNDPLLTYCERCERGEHPALNEWENKQQQIADVKEDPYYIESIENPCEEAQVIAVQQVPLLIKYIENPCEEAQLEAITHNPDVIEHIKNPSQRIKDLAKDLQFKNYFTDVIQVSSKKNKCNVRDDRDDL